MNANQMIKQAKEEFFDKFTDGFGEDYYDSQFTNEYRPQYIWYNWIEPKISQAITQAVEEAKLDAQTAYDETYKFVDSKHGGRQAMKLYSEFKKILDKLTK